MTFTVRVPATSANLGPGFDCLGLALNLWNELEVSVSGTSLNISVTGEGQASLPKNAHNSIYQVMQATAKHLGKPLPIGLNLNCTNRIPLGSGLGSSSAAIVAGVLAAYELLGVPPNKEDVLEISAQLEGHPDNVAPCIFGGLTASMTHEGHFLSISLPITALSLVVVSPDFAFPTSKARAALPLQVPHADAVFNLSHTVFLVEALARGDYDLLAKAMQDRLHQPYRLPLIPGAASALQAALTAGAAAAAISGAGSSLLAILKRPTDSAPVSAAMQAAFSDAGLSSRVFTPAVSLGGGEITR